MHVVTHTQVILEYVCCHILWSPYVSSRWCFNIKSTAPVNDKIFLLKHCGFLRFLGYWILHESKKTDFNYCYISHRGKITLFVHKFTWIRYMNKCEICEKCEFCEKFEFVENVNFVNLVKHVNLVKTMRILWKCEFVENLNFLNLVKIWILWKNVNYVKKYDF